MVRESAGLRGLAENQSVTRNQLGSYATMRQPSFWRSVSHACAGLVHTFLTQRNARWHVIGALFAVALGVWLRIGLTDWAILALTIGAVAAGETINTTVEALVDLMSPEWHERAKTAKDVSAGAVLLLALTAVVVGLLVLGPPLWERLFGQAH